MDEVAMTSEGSQMEEVTITKRLENGLTKTLTIRQIENGYIIRKNVYGSIDDKYKDVTKEYYSKENPIDSKSEEEKESEEMGNLLNSIKHL